MRATVDQCGDIQLDGWCWLDIDPEASESYEETVTLTADQRWCVLRGSGEGGQPHHGPSMPWKAWVALARTVIASYGALVSREARAWIGSGRLTAGRTCGKEYRGTEIETHDVRTCSGRILRNAAASPSLSARRIGTRELARRERLGLD